jgi:hypothetical protein
MPQISECSAGAFNCTQHIASNGLADLRAVTAWREGALLERARRCSLLLHVVQWAAPTS